MSVQRRRGRMDWCTGNPWLFVESATTLFIVGQEEFTLLKRYIKFWSRTTTFNVQMVSLREINVTLWSSCSPRDAAKRDSEEVHFALGQVMLSNSRELRRNLYRIYFA